MEHAVIGKESKTSCKDHWMMCITRINLCTAGVKFMHEYLASSARHIFFSSTTHKLATSPSHTTTPSSQSPSCSPSLALSSPDSPSLRLLPKSNQIVPPSWVRVMACSWYPSLLNPPTSQQYSDLVQTFLLWIMACCLRATCQVERFFFLWPLRRIAISRCLVVGFRGLSRTSRENSWEESWLSIV